MVEIINYFHDCAIIILVILTKAWILQIVTCNIDFLKRLYTAQNMAKDGFSLTRILQYKIY